MQATSASSLLVISYSSFFNFTGGSRRRRRGRRRRAPRPRPGRQPRRRWWGREPGPRRRGPRWLRRRQGRRRRSSSSPSRLEDRIVERVGRRRRRWAGLLARWIDDDHLLLFVAPLLLAWGRRGRGRGATYSWIGGLILVGGWRSQRYVRVCARDEWAGSFFNVSPCV